MTPIVMIPARNLDESPFSGPALLAQFPTGGLMHGRPQGHVMMAARNAPPAEAVPGLTPGEIRRVPPRATWTAAGIGVNQAPGLAA